MLSNKVIHFKQNQLNIPVKPLYCGLLLLGIVLRLIPYFLNRSLWLDEAAVAVNISDRNFAGLLHPLDYGQVAPILFLLIEKANIVLFGNSEQSLRLLPLICGILSLPLIYRLTKQISGNAYAALIALFLFAISPVLIDYSNEVKQYEGDVFSALCLLNLVFDTSLAANENKRFILLAIAGAVLIFLSNVAVLTLFSIGVYYLFKYKLAIFRLPVLLVAFGCWLMSFLAYYHFFIVHDTNNRLSMLAFWHDYFMPFPVFTPAFWSWMQTKYLTPFNFYSQLYKWAFLLSVIIFIAKKQGLYLYLLLVPLAVHFIISGFKLYPFDTRLILYLMVFITPAIAIGIFELAELIKKRITIYPVVFLLMLLVYSNIAQLVNTHYPFWKEEIKQSIDFINANKTNGQKVYVYYASRQPVNYYIDIKRVHFKNYLVWGTDDWGWVNHDNCYNDISKLNGEVWLLFSHIYPTYVDDEGYTIKRLTDAHDTVLKTFKTIGSSAYLVKINSK